VEQRSQQPLAHISGTNAQRTAERLRNDGEQEELLVKHIVMHIAMYLNIIDINKKYFLRAGLIFIEKKM
jgi:hypothetical protein